jgi:hypothetical protein
MRRLNSIVSSIRSLDSLVSLRGSLDEAVSGAKERVAHNAKCDMLLYPPARHTSSIAVYSPSGRRKLTILHFGLAGCGLLDLGLELIKAAHRTQSARR